MIGVIASVEAHDVVREFFELFKTPWEFYHRGRHYDVVLAAGDVDVREVRARVTVLYASAPTSMEAGAVGAIASGGPGRTLSCRDGSRIRLHCGGLTFGSRGDLLTDEASGQSAASIVGWEDGVLVRVGYDLFAEIRRALTVGQPPAQADIPVIEAHIAFLRGVITDHAAPLIEIPPIPAGHPFIVCLTHDVDHAAIRLHRWDHTTLGFVYRAVLGSLGKVIRRRASLRDLLTNWLAALKLPFVHLGLARDFWSDLDRYVQIDGGAGSTFFVIPFRDCPGQTESGSAPRRRASRYAASDIAGQIGGLVALGADVGVHGIDAWRDSSRGREELEQIAKITGDAELGVRMHWLYFDQGSPVLLEKAGFTYDSTSGYNETVGYRAGTTQVFKPLSAIRLLELPLHVMDTALFYPSRLDLSQTEAGFRVRGIVNNALRYGGVLTVNWHDRSIAPERLWGEFYRKLVDELKRKEVWFTTAARAVAWFRRRREAVVEATTSECGDLRVRVAVAPVGDLPGLRLRVHRRRDPGALVTDSYTDIVVTDGLDAAVPI